MNQFVGRCFSHDDNTCYCVAAESKGKLIGLKCMRAKGPNASIFVGALIDLDPSKDREITASDFLNAAGPVADSIQNILHQASQAAMKQQARAAVGGLVDKFLGKIFE